MSAARPAVLADRAGNWRQAFAFAAVQAITSGAFDPWLHRIRGAVLMRARTQEYQDTLIAGEHDDVTRPRTTETDDDDA